MPHPDPVPTPNNAIRRRFWRVLRLLMLLSAVAAAIGVLLVTRGSESPSIHLVIATALGIFFTMLVGTGLMSLVFLSAASGHDDTAGTTHHHPDSKDDE